MRKHELVAIWKKLDKSLEAIERLDSEGLRENDNGVLFGEILSLKNEVEEMIEEKTKKTR